MIEMTMSFVISSHLLNTKKKVDKNFSNKNSLLKIKKKYFLEDSSPEAEFMFAGMGLDSKSAEIGLLLMVKFICARVVRPLQCVLGVAPRGVQFLFLCGFNHGILTD